MRPDSSGPKYMQIKEKKIEWLYRNIVMPMHNYISI